MTKSLDDMTTEELLGLAKTYASHSKHRLLLIAFMEKLTPERAGWWKRMMAFSITHKGEFYSFLTFLDNVSTQEQDDA